MIDILMNEIRQYVSSEAKVNHLREMLQSVILRVVYDSGFFKNLVFVGGTALRIVYGIRRYSEDLDFSLVNKRGYSLDKIKDALEKHLKAYGFDVTITRKGKIPVEALAIKFSHLLFEAGVSTLRNEMIYIKFEIDENPPAGGTVILTPVNKVFTFTIVHYDLPSLFAGKLHACAFRQYTKGRDFYDLFWYLSKKIKPNLNLLNNAIRQTQGPRTPRLTEGNYKEFLTEIVRKGNFKTMQKDVSRFLEDPSDAELLTAETFMTLIYRL